MYRLLYIAVFLLAALGASAQNMPERSEVRRGNRQYNKGNYEKSIERYERALEAAPESFEATLQPRKRALQGRTVRQGRADHAARRRPTTLRTDDERAQAFYNLGNAQFKQQKYKEALESYKQSLRLNPCGSGGQIQLRLHQASDRRRRERRRWRRRRQESGQRPEQGSAAAGQRSGPAGRRSAERRPTEGRQGAGRRQGAAGRPAAEPRAARQGAAKAISREQPQPVPAGISPQEQEQMLDAIQAQEDRTQDKLKEKQGVVVRGSKNW